MGRRRKGDPVNGWLIVDKPTGMTSTAVVNRARRETNAAKVGHGGTLDPLATGVLPLAFGEATKLLPYVVDSTKDYRFTLAWGAETATDDREGTVTETSDRRPDEREIRAVLPDFVGEISQVPPAFSAIKVDGQRAYDLARSDAPPDLSPRTIVIHDLELEAMPDRDHAVFRVTSGKGAYMRALARDIARALGTAGHVGELRRLRVGPFTEDMAISLAQQNEIGHSAPLLAQMRPVETALDDIPALAVTESEESRLRRGQAVPVVRTQDRELIGTLVDGDIVAALHGEKLVALTYLDGRQIRPVRVLNT